MPKAEKRRADTVEAMPATEPPTTGGSDVSDRDVARRAYELYCARGCEDGHDVDDWLAAEGDLQRGLHSSAA